MCGRFSTDGPDNFAADGNGNEGGPVDGVALRSGCGCGCPLIPGILSLVELRSSYGFVADAASAGD